MEHRKYSRFLTLAKARIDGANEGETLLRDISVTGCRLECTAYSEIKLNKLYELEIIPESSTKIGTFNLEAESMWTRTGSYSCEIGFTITKSPKGKHFERYVDYLSWRYSQGNSMVESDASEIPMNI